MDDEYPTQILSCPEKPAFNTCGRKCPGTLNMGDMFGQPAEPIISLRWRFFSFCFDARQPPIHGPSTSA